MLNKWIAAFKQILPIYLITHIAFFLLTIFSVLLSRPDFGNQASTSSLPGTWLHWDAKAYRDIALYGYSHQLYRSAFFPLFPMLERIGAKILHDPFIAGLIIANSTGIIFFTMLYQLVKEDTSHEVALRTVLFLAIFPSAFFLAAAYTESLYLALVLVSFYQIRHGRFWQASLFGFFACLTRSTGIFLILPFAYNYLRERRRIDFHAISVLLIPAGIALYSWYCYKSYGDVLAWDHAQVLWSHQVHFPWDTLLITFEQIAYNLSFLSFSSLHNYLDLVPVLFILVMLVSMVWRRYRMDYTFYAIPLFLFFLSVPIVAGKSPVPLQSIPRHMLEVFPAFIVTASLGRHHWFHEGYLIISGSLLAISCLLYLTGHWMV